MIDSRVSRRRLLGAGAALLGARALPAAAQDTYPSRPIRLVVCYAPGGPVDTAARQLAPLLSAKLNNANIVVENRPGGGGTIGAEAVARSAPDGYTLMFAASPPLTITPHLLKRMPFDSLKDFSPVGLYVDYANVLVVAPDSPFKTLAELIAYAKANPEKVSYGSAGVGGSNHLSGELLARMTGTKMLHIPYKGNAPAMTDVMGGKITMMFDITGTSAGYVQSGRVRALGISSSRRNASLPDVPTMIEAGVPGFDVVGWFALLGPAGMPRPLVDQINGAVHAVLADKAFEAKLNGQGYDVHPSTPEELRAVIQRDLDMWGKVIRDAKIEVE
ncbi:MAG: tripartite tricarboxylate transporter substrate binding protein [Burkholderiaceae bacterium]